jgi:hypothetical protein
VVHHDDTALRVNGFSNSSQERIGLHYLILSLLALVPNLIVLINSNNEPTRIKRLKPFGSWRYDIGNVNERQKVALT